MKKYDKEFFFRDFCVSSRQTDIDLNVLIQYVKQTE